MWYSISTKFSKLIWEFNYNRLQGPVFQCNVCDNVESDKVNYLVKNCFNSKRGRHSVECGMGTGSQDSK